jgi:hypothetical protein
MKILVKGIETPEDAELCVRYGADGVIVSNHGGRATNSGRATIDSLPDVLRVVRGRIPVWWMAASDAAPMSSRPWRWARGRFASGVPICGASPRLAARSGGSARDSTKGIQSRDAECGRNRLPRSTRIDPSVRVAGSPTNWICKVRERTFMTTIVRFSLLLRTERLKGRVAARERR